MALPNPTSIVTASATLVITDIATSASVLSHVLPNVSYKAVEVQYFGYLNILPNANLTFTATSPAGNWAVVFVRNLGGQGSGNVLITFVATAVNLDVGAEFLFISPILSSVVVAGVLPGVGSVNISSA